MVPNIKVLCRIDGCGYEDHILVQHLNEQHGLTPEEYIRLHPEAPIASPLGMQEMERAQAALEQNQHHTRRTPLKKTVAQPPRGRKEFGIRETFGIDLGFEEDDNGKPKVDPTTKQPIPKERKVQGFAEPTDFTPAIDPSYVFPPEETKVLLLGLALRDNVLLVGETGTGKTSLIEQVAARLNFSVVKINFDGCITRQDLVGEWVVKGKEMIFQYGILVHAFQMPGTIVIFDEWDTISAECSFVLQRPLQKDDRKILLMETGGELIPLHPDNVLMGTANTAGQGDDTGLYSQGTKVQNYAQLNRWSMTIRLKYLDEAKEIQMIGKRFPELKVQECTALVKAINAVRDGYVNGQISAPLSPRDLINWAEKYIKMGDPTRAAKYCFLNRMTEEDSTVTEGLIQRAFESA
jgi:cobaltochelatase CobS